MDLGGTWRAARLDPELHRSGADLDLDDSDWPKIDVPGHWAEQEDFAYTSGPILHRRRFTMSAPPEEVREWLVLEGVLAESDVWLDGHFLGTTTGYFAPHTYEIGDALREREDHVLAVEVNCPNPSPGEPKRTFTGSLQSGPLAPPGSPGGIWRPVHTRQTGPVAILHSRLLCTEATAERGALSVRLVLDAVQAMDLRIDTSVTGHDGVAAAGASELHTVSHGENRLEWEIPIKQPRRWWPKALGDQPLYEVAVALRTEDGTVTDRREWRTGIRKIEVNDLQFSVNGERLFTKGIALGPQTRFPGSVDPAVITEDVTAAAQMGLDLIRVHGHVARPELYSKADEIGMLIWQDLPLSGTYTTRARKGARVIARSVVDVLGHHPSVAVWCAHDEPNGSPVPEPGRADETLAGTATRLGRQILPSWNRSVLGPTLRRELSSSDSTRSVILRSGAVPGFSPATSSDPHLWLGWHAARHEDLAEIVRKWPRLGRFLGGFGAQSVRVADWPETAPEWLTAETGAFDRYLPRRAYGQGEAWALATRAYQADLIRSQIENVRRLKYSPTVGFCLTSLADAEPDGGFGVFEYDRSPKPARDALVDACRPVIVVGDSLPTVVTAGQRIHMDVHAISDLRTGLGSVRVKARASVGTWQHATTWAGELGPDTCERIGALSFVVPDLNGALLVDLELTSGERFATNRYRTVVIPRAEASTRQGV